WSTTMSLNKYAGWGALPAVAPPKASALPGLLDAIGHPLAPGGTFDQALWGLGQMLAAINATIGKIGPAPVPGPPGVPVPSQSAVLIVWSLTGVRDALCDQRNASLASTNRQLKTQANSARTKAIGNWLAQNYPPVATDFGLQFRDLSGAPGFDVERR